LAKLLVVDDEQSIREVLGVILRRGGHEVVLSPRVTDAKARIASEGFDLVLTDLMMPDGSGMEVLEAARANDENTQVIMITAYATTAQAVEAMRKGAYDYIQKPFKNDEIRVTVEKALEKRDIVDQNRALRAQARERWNESGILGRGAAMDRVRALVQRVASAPRVCSSPARAARARKSSRVRSIVESDRQAKPFVVVNCGALPEALMESELFGHEKGAFTGANSAKEGLFRAAQGGTIFLDEIGELPLPLQVKLLRVLQERSVRPVGGSKELPIDARVVAATNRELELEVKAGRFRQDLFYRLNVIRLHLPPLRERREDIPVLAEHFLVKHAALLGRKLTFSPEVMRWLTQQVFMGNVRELENTVERAATLALGAVVQLDDIPEAMMPQPKSLLEAELGPTFDLERYMAEVERGLLERALAESNGVRTKAAALLGMSFRQFRYRLAKYGKDDDAPDGAPPETM
jgi:two-component system response regulator PilR (NtrC family)